MESQHVITNKWVPSGLVWALVSHSSTVFFLFSYVVFTPASAGRNKWDFQWLILCESFTHLRGCWRTPKVLFHFEPVMVHTLHMCSHCTVSHFSLTWNVDYVLCFLKVSKQAVVSLCLFSFFRATLYVGKYSTSLYASPSLVHDGVTVVVSDSYILSSFYAKRKPNQSNTRVKYVGFLSFKMCVFIVKFYSSLISLPFWLVVTRRVTEFAWIHPVQDVS